MWRQISPLQGVRSTPGLVRLLRLHRLAMLTKRSCVSFREMLGLEHLSVSIYLHLGSDLQLDLFEQGNNFRGRTLSLGALFVGMAS